MNTDTIEQLFKSYLDAYADIAPAERERLLRQSVSDDVGFTNPTGDGKGFSNLIEHIEGFQKRAPGAYFKSNKLLAHHGELLAEWALFKKDGSEFTTGHTYGRLNEQGRLTHLAGFFKPRTYNQ
jgi:hypothetical protein